MLATLHFVRYLHYKWEINNIEHLEPSREVLSSLCVTA